MQEEKRLKIAWDVDGVLIIPATETGLDIDTPNYDNIKIFNWFKERDYKMIIWSGSGIDWAKTWAEKLGLQPVEIRVKEKSDDIDVCFDDEIVDLAKVNIKV